MAKFSKQDYVGIARVIDTTWRKLFVSAVTTEQRFGSSWHARAWCPRRARKGDMMFTIHCTRPNDATPSWTMTEQGVWEVASITSLHTNDVSDLVSATFTYRDGTVLAVNRES